MKTKGQKWEKIFIKTLNSGAIFGDADATSQEEALEIKFREGKGFNITTKILEKLWEQAFNQNKIPLLGIGIKDGNNLWLLKIQVNKKIK